MEFFCFKVSFFCSTREIFVYANHIHDLSQSFDTNTSLQYDNGEIGSLSDILTHSLRGNVVPLHGIDYFQSLDLVILLQVHEPNRKQTLEYTLER